MPSGLLVPPGLCRRLGQAVGSALAGFLAGAVKTRRLFLEGVGAPVADFGDFGQQNSFLPLVARTVSKLTMALHQITRFFGTSHRAPEPEEPLA